jgi:hypothetical protein
MAYNVWRTVRSDERRREATRVATPLAPISAPLATTRPLTTAAPTTTAGS